jgi:Lon protease-like protein
MDEAVDVLELPLFPLSTVLFPGQLLPLHIFEDRYRLMIRRCLAEDLQFGVVLIRRGREVGEKAEPNEVGTMARILESSHLEDGTLNIITAGTERFRIRRLINDQPYLRGEVTMYPLVDDAVDDPASLAGQTRAGVEEYIRLIAAAAGLQLKVDEIPEDPQRLGYLAAVAMQIDNKEKQELLASPTVGRILRADLRLLRRENALLEWMTRTKEWPGQVEFGPSGTLLPN